MRWHYFAPKLCLLVTASFPGSVGLHLCCYCDLTDFNGQVLSTLSLLVVFYPFLKKIPDTLLNISSFILPLNNSPTNSYSQVCFFFLVHPSNVFFLFSSPLPTTVLNHIFYFALSLLEQPDEPTLPSSLLRPFPPLPHSDCAEASPQ